MRLSHRLAACTAVVLAVAGCGAGAGSPPDVTGEWELLEFSRDGTVVPEPVGGRATLTLADGELEGTSFCNSYTGTYRLDGEDLAVSGLGGTEMGCAPELMEAEVAYLKALAAVEQAATGDGYLVLSGGDAELTYRPIPEVPPSDLTDTGWVLETLLDGDVASSPTGDRAVLELADGGTLTASTGCRELTARWSVDGDVVRVTDPRTTDAACDPDVAPQDEQVTALLSRDFQVTVSEDSLTLTGAGGLGLVYSDAG